MFLIRTKSGIFKPTKRGRGGDGKSYDKPFLYLAHAIYLHQKTDEEIAGLTQKIKELAKAEFKIGSKRVLGEKSGNQTIRDLTASPKKKRASLANID